MRLTGKQRDVIARSIHRHLGDEAEVWLFGSRLDDHRRGGDVDLYVEAVSHTLMQEIRCKIQLAEALDMPVDLIVRARQDESPIARIAKQQGVRL